MNEWEIELRMQNMRVCVCVVVRHSMTVIGKSGRKKKKGEILIIIVSQAIYLFIDSTLWQ